ncbi:chitinase [Deinobacterium chartae]|uniref:chitinase n=1 Tax=Deinobacterium chartae TaxID=521158 RepID=A0A841I5K5_9DEIO|nr:glycosyl hydrolase family 18 protein [Deinobacterium chartae]MBB6099155.1 chitinase [Deinobacterium chartae]
MKKILWGCLPLLTAALAACGSSPEVRQDLLPTPSAAVTASSATSQTVQVGHFEVTYAVTSDWGSGFMGSITIKNNGPLVNGWKLEWTYAGDQKIAGMWNGVPTQNGQKVSVANASYNAQLYTGDSVTIGFQGEYSGTNTVPTVFTLNGVSNGQPGGEEPPPPPPPGGTWVMGYYVGYHHDKYPLEAVNWQAMTHVAVGRLMPYADGTISTDFDIDWYNGPRWAKSVVDRAHANNRKTILMLGGAGTRGGFVGAASPQNRSTFVTNILKVVDQYGFDGVDLDWEPVEAEDQEPLRALAEELRARRPGLLLTLPVNYVNTTWSDLDLPYYASIAPLFDRVNIMSYAMNGVYDSWHSWHSSALTGSTRNTPTSVETSVDAYINAGIEPGKLGVGIGFFGSCYSGVTGPNQFSDSMKLVADDNDMSYTNIMSSYYSEAVKRWDDRAKVPYLSSEVPLGPKGCNFVSYEDPQSIALKGEFVRSRGLGGAIIWNINEGYLPTAPAGSRDPLMDAVKQAFLQ